MDLELFALIAEKDCKQANSKQFFPHSMCHNSKIGKKEQNKNFGLTKHILHEGRDIICQSAMVAQKGTSITKLLDGHKCITDELFNSLKDFNAGKISLENELNCLNQENEYLKLEIARQKANIDDLNESAKDLSDKLSKEEAETKKIVELKLLEVEEVLHSIKCTDKYMAKFIANFSESLAEVKKYCNYIKKYLKIMLTDSYKKMNEDLNSFEKVTNEFNVDYKDLLKYQLNMSENESKMERDISLSKEKFMNELDNLSLEIEIEQKRKKDLDTGLLHYSNLIVKIKDDHSLCMNNNEMEINQLKEEFSQLNLKNSWLKEEISSSENDLIYLKEKDFKMSTDMNSLQAVLVTKRRDDEIIQQDIEQLEKLAELKSEDREKSLIEMNTRKHIEAELQELQFEVASMMNRCNDLKECRIQVLKADSSALLNDDKNL